MAPSLRGAGLAFLATLILTLPSCRPPVPVPDEEPIPIEITEEHPVDSPNEDSAQPPTP